MSVGHTHTAKILAPSSDFAREVGRLRVRRAAYHVAADCDHLLDELSQLDRPGWTDLLTRTLVATRQLIGLLGPGHELATIFDADLKPSARLADAHRRIVTATNSLAVKHASPGEDAMLTAIVALREAAGKILEAAGDHSSIASHSPQPGADEKPGGSVVLVVDDNPAMSALVSRAVRRLGHEVVIVDNGRMALERALAGGIDLILTDIDMPVMTGIELLEALKADPSIRAIPTIVISGNGDMSKVAKCIELGAVDHILKPFEHELLRARITTSLENRRLHLAGEVQRSGVARLIAAAEAVENDAYAQGSLDPLTGGKDGLAQLARVFDRMVSGLKSREDRLRHRLQHLRREVGTSAPGLQATDSVKDEAFHTGALVAMRYEILGQLGEGGMGTVYSARDQQLNEDVVLKVVRPDLLKNDSSLVARLKSEVRLARKISHRNVVRAHDIGEWKDRHFITMELVRGVSVADMLDRHGRISVGSTLAIATQLAEALAVAHESEIIHRDIKPANLLIDETGCLKVMDFGIARQIEVDGPGITAHGYVIGTPQYMAPEILVGGVATFQTDLFALGVVVYECLAGRVPHFGGTPSEAIALIFNGLVEPLDRVVPEVPKALARLVHQQLSYEPGARSASARALAEKLAEIEHTRD